jgi:uncharacterized damage-inducible protein DinB
MSGKQQSKDQNVHPVVAQLRFTRREFLRGVKGVNEEDARHRLLPMNSLSWNVGHLAWQEQRYFLHFGQGLLPYPDIANDFAYGAPASTPAMSEVLKAWRAITKAADPWLDRLTSSDLESFVMKDGKPTARMYGNLMQRLIYHYWYHTGENQAIRQQLGHSPLPEYVGNIDGEAPYRSD